MLDYGVASTAAIPGGGAMRHRGGGGGAPVAASEEPEHDREVRRKTLNELREELALEYFQ